MFFNPADCHYIYTCRICAAILSRDSLAYVSLVWVFFTTYFGSFICFGDFFFIKFHICWTWIQTYCLDASKTSLVGFPHCVEQLVALCCFLLFGRVTVSLTHSQFSFPILSSKVSNENNVMLYTILILIDIIFVNI